MWNEFKKQFGWLIFGVKKKKRPQTRVYLYDGKPIVSVKNGKVSYHSKRKPRRRQSRGAFND